ncbi:MAG: GNAT family N-acetyltransferase [Bacteroidetes bacterium]|nr:GNAT family N-acetyltransferase [Bacteroidota bacterium]
MIKEHYTTDRLDLKALQTTDNEFIYELVNTPEWITYIGERNVHSAEETIPYIQKIMDNPLVQYWVVRLKSDQTSLGVITLIKRDYLDHHDIGFAFLPSQTKKGYAYEAALHILKECFANGHETILATTIKENHPSIQLLKKLGLTFSKEIIVEEEVSLVYEIIKQTS